MDLSSTKRISADDRAYRLQNGLCLTCGIKGHFARDCTGKDKDKRQAKLTNVEDADEIAFVLGNDNAQ